MPLNLKFNVDESEIETLKIFGALAEGLRIDWALVNEPFIEGYERSLRNKNISVIVNKSLTREGNSLWRYGHTHFIETNSKVIPVNWFFPADGYQEIFSEALAEKQFVDGIPVLSFDWFLILSFYVELRIGKEKDYMIFDLIDRQTFRRFRKNMIKHFGKTAWEFSKSGYRQNR